MPALIAVMTVWQAGYYCNVCDCILRDSATYLDHINGRWHNRALGMSMVAERSTVNQVRTKLTQLKSKKGTAEPLDVVADGEADLSVLCYCLWETGLCWPGYAS